MAGDLEVTDQRTKRLAAEHPELFLIDLLEHHALVELGRTLQVAEEFLLAGVQHTNFQVGSAFGLVNQVLQPAPRSFQFLEIRVVQDLVELDRDQVIDLGDARIDHCFRIAGESHLPCQELGDELLDEVTASFPGGRIARQPSLFDDLVQQADFLGPFHFGRLCG
jgi:hypothetical protein